MSDAEKKQQNTGELTNNELKDVQGGVSIPASGPAVQGHPGGIFPSAIR